MANEEKASEFHSEEQRDGYLDGLAHEKEGYEARLAVAQEGLPERLDEAQLQSRIDQVDAEIKRVQGVKVPARKRSRRAPAAAKAASGATKD
jgi:hypothetical protein